MNDEICECGHSINKHYLDNPSEGEPSGYCTHYYEEKHVFCNCRKSPGEIASVLRARAEELEQQLRDLVQWLDDNKSTIKGEFDMDELLRPARVALAKGAK